MTHVNGAAVIAAALLVGAGIATAGYFVGQTIYNSQVAVNTAEVKGLAEKRVEADRAFWKIQYTVSGTSTSDMAQLYAQSEVDQKKIVALLLESGFEATELSPGVIDTSTEEFRDENQKLVEKKISLIGSIDVETAKVRKVAEVRSKLNTLVAQGLAITNNPPAYHFTKLNAIKPEMVKEATTNARIAANEFAVNAGVKVGGIKDAQQGGFLIRDVGEEYGDTKNIEKDVRVVTTITFYLTE
ncbi:hypothetical protein DFR24_0067 [Panacagrimonas perspica]|uniref:SIMPL domain-containing protein n=1 Tax=Panacagrimonas perspica TaxID=381431 RepID=A0A4V6RR10_9GAMM|nr:SIMPL domain-containing protein [Panacagrimonas perspica]TDU30713.1 hypothetical protein DFR24_0067 [Panacagrimonas perspica]THD01541.1 hypothetical protein B1810_18645 [Panacagrimonas perspica]